MAYYIGIMSGTSLDGVDITLVDIDDDNGQCKFISAETVPYPGSLLNDLQSALNQTRHSLKEIGELDIKLGSFIAEQINLFLQQQQLTSADIKAIGNHGHTLFHSPDSHYAFSQQIANNNCIAELTEITTVGDFRQRDIAVGGQGAPLVPAFHQQQFTSSDEHRVVVNIGGISNITLLPKNDDYKVIGFDTGPGNGLLDSWIARIQGEHFDKDGEWAKTGSVHPELLKAMLADPYFQKPIPKSTGREYFNLSWITDYIDDVVDPTVSAEDVQATLIDLTAISISQHIEHFCQQATSIYVCGGGAHNPVLLGRLRDLNEQRRVTTTEELGLHPDWVEGCAFAWLAYRTLNGLPGNLPSVTGAHKPVVLGAIYSFNEAS